MSDFRPIIKKRMKQQNISTPKLARLIVCFAVTLYIYFQGKSELTAANLSKIFDVLKIKVC